MKNLHYYDKHLGDLKQRLKSAVDLKTVRELHTVRPVRHMLVVVPLASIPSNNGIGVNKKGVLDKSMARHHHCDYNEERHEEVARLIHTHA